MKCRGKTKKGDNCRNKIGEASNYCWIHKLDTCSICLDELNNFPQTKILCNHKFHKKCIMKWFKNNTSCPVCRQDVYKTMFYNPEIDNVENDIIDTFLEFLVSADYIENTDTINYYIEDEFLEINHQEQSFILYFTGGVEGFQIISS